MKPGDLVTLTLSRNSVKKGSIGLIVTQLTETKYHDSVWFTCIFDGNLLTVHGSTLDVINEAW